MKQHLKRAVLLSGIVCSCVISTFGQTANADTAYTRVITQRAEKIVAPLGIADAAQTAAVRDIIVQQYRNLNALDTMQNAELKAAKRDKLHKEYLSRLSARLSAQQVDQVKDGMTYGVLPLTYKGYMAMLPDLTEQQRAQIMAWLVEAREHAIDGGTSEEKHRWFGKYKGKINNYLAAAGYNMKEAEAAWRKRMKTRK